MDEIGKEIVLQLVKDVGDIKGELAALKANSATQTKETEGVKKYAMAFAGGVWALVIMFVSVWMTVHFTGHF